MSKYIQQFYCKFFNGDEDFNVEDYGHAVKCLKTILKGHSKNAGKKTKKLPQSSSKRLKEKELPLIKSTQKANLKKKKKLDESEINISVFQLDNCSTVKSFKRNKTNL